jgi:hypothetical protein
VSDPAALGSGPEQAGRPGNRPSDRLTVVDAAGTVLPLGRLAARAATPDHRATADRPATDDRPATADRSVVLIDGRSGTGKTTLGIALAEQLGAQLVHLDDVYPGWDGLRAAADAVVDEILAAPDATGRPRWRRWDWSAGLPAEWNALDATRPVVVEGCGALSRRSAPLATLRIWLDGNDTVRKARALARDGDTFAREWDRWAAEERAFIDAEDPRALADVVLRLP